MPTITENVKKARETVVEQSKVAFDEAKKPLYFALGAGDLALAQLRTLPAETQLQVKRLQDRATELQTRAAGLKPAELRTALDEYVAKVRSTYAELAERGEQVLAKAVRQPGVKVVLGKAESLFDKAEDAVEDLIEELDDDAPKTGARKAPARKTPARRTTR